MRFSVRSHFRSTSATFNIENKCTSLLIKNKLITSNQSGFRPGDSVTNQLIYFVHEILKNFDCLEESANQVGFHGYAQSI